jgi:hypothetical protein
MWLRDCSSVLIGHGTTIQVRSRVQVRSRAGTLLTVDHTTAKKLLGISQSHTSFDLLKTPIIIVAATSDLPDPGSIAADLVWAV